MALTLAQAKQLSDSKLVNQIIHILEEHKLENVEAIDVSSRTPFSSYYVLATCLNTRQLSALPDTLESDLAKIGVSIRKTNGTEDTGWIIIDTYEVMIHLFTQEARQIIALEDVLSK